MKPENINNFNTNSEQYQYSQQPSEPKYPVNVIRFSMLIALAVSLIIFCPITSFPINIIFSLISTLFVSLFIFPFAKHSYNKQMSEYHYWKDNPQEYQQYLKKQKIEKEEELRTKTVVYAGATTPIVKCPYCHSTNTHQISTIGRGVSTVVFGLASSKIGKQWHCNKCGSDF